MRPSRLVDVRHWKHRYPGEVLDLARQRFGRLTAKRVSGRDDYGRTIWLCMCDCGRTKDVRMDYLRSGTTKSCGCLRKRVNLL